MIADGATRELSINCEDNRAQLILGVPQCEVAYNGFDYNGFDDHAEQTHVYVGYDLRLTVATASVAYALSVALPVGQPAIDVKLTVYSPDAATGTAGIVPILDGSLGNWSQASGWTPYLGPFVWEPPGL